MQLLCMYAELFLNGWTNFDEIVCVYFSGFKFITGPGRRRRSRVHSLTICFTGNVGYSASIE